MIAQIRDEVSSATVDGPSPRGRRIRRRMSGPADPSPEAAIPIAATTRIGDTLTGAARFSDGEVHDYAALVLRGPNANAARAILLSTIDRSGAEALRDLGRTLPIVILVTAPDRRPARVRPVALDRAARSTASRGGRASSSMPAGSTVRRRRWRSSARARCATRRPG